MSYAYLLVSNLARNLTQTLLTGGCLTLAFLMFGLLQPVNQLFSRGPEMGAEPRLVVGPKHSNADLLPLGYAHQIDQIDGVQAVTHLTWFGGNYVDTNNFFPQFAADTRTLFQVLPELSLPAEHRTQFLANRASAIVGRTTAEKYNFEVGDVIPLIPTIWHNSDGKAWDFTLAGIFESTDLSVVNNTGFYFHYDYFDSYRAFANATVGTLLVKSEPSYEPSALAATIDTRFTNAVSETKTQTDREYALSFARQLGDVGLIVTAVLGAVFFTIVLLTGNTMSNATRARTSELAVLRVLGFSKTTVVCSVIAEAAVLTATSCAIGLGLAQLLLAQLPAAIPALQQVGVLAIDGEVAAQGALIACLVALGVGLPPALRAVNTSIVNALRV